MARIPFDVVASALSKNCLQVSRRPEGVAFFKTARDLYQMQGITYFCIDIPSTKPKGVFSHCAYSDTDVIHCVSHCPLKNEIELGAKPTTHLFGLSALQIPLRKHCGELANFEVVPGVDFAKGANRESIQRELRILANYFHSHVLRISGHDVDGSVLMSAKELDCLKWTAAGKTAWEASVILGVSERTVRFHLNAAREKLQCTTTTQAVAKAIAQQLIDV
jgi:DNA-binding CsgD family transcriptional regulator